ncbi:Tat pathway signal protein [Halobacteriales archaeon QS_9_67_15]|nr:MAG: Tat pathway signal protein [Halobacteriales archaeon QS_9_67_15]
MPPRRSRGVSRRDFVKAAVAIGGASALSACLGREDPDLPGGPDDLSALPDRQHAWNDALATDDHGNHVPPRHHLLLYLDYAGDGTPTDDDRDTVETALRSLEHAYPRSTDDGDVGLLFTVGYAPAYFERFDEALPERVDLPAPEPLAPFEDPTPDEPDAVVHLASDYGSVLLAAEEGLLGEATEVNGRELDATFEGVFERAALAGDGPNRRTGFIGEGLPAENQDVTGIPDSEPVSEDSPLYMGFESGFEKTQATEDRVTIDGGPFAGGTTQHVSTMHLNLDQWYEQDTRYHREATMFCPAHADEDRIEGTGENLGDTSGVGACAAGVEEDAREKGVVGHAQKNARVREDGRPVILRRDFDSTDGNQAGLHFLALQQAVSDFVATREAMNGSDVADEAAVGQRANNGILQYINVRRRGNYLLPPRESRALPTPSA